MARSTTVLCLFSLIAFASSERLFGICDFESENEHCGLIKDSAFEQSTGRPSWNFNAMDAGYSGSGYLLLTSYNSESTASTPILTATKGDEKLSFAYFLNGEGENKAYIHVYIIRDNNNEELLGQADSHKHQWQFVTISLNAVVGEQFQIVFKAKAHKNIWTTQHTWLGLDYIQILNDGGSSKCFRPPPVQYANPWSCYSQARSTLRRSTREELPEGTICTTTCRTGFVPQGQPKLVCNNGQWEEEGEVVFMCLDESPPEFESCPTDLNITTPFGWGSTWYTIMPPVVSDNTNAWAIELYVDNELQSDSTITTALAPGTYSVNFVATDMNYNQNTCSYQITVVTGDQNPPTVVQCTKSFSVESDSPLVVGWSEPIFVDDSGYIAKVESNYLPTSVMAWGKHDVVYTAYDNSSNAATCSFTVTVRGLACNTLTLPINGALVCHDSYSGSFCASMCGPDGDFDLSTPELSVPDDYLCSASGNWYPYEFIYNCLADYSDTTVKSENYYFSGACNETATQDAMRIQAVSIYNAADVDPTMGQNLTPSDFYVTCGPRSQ